ncbi:hypothetical protein ACEPAF_7432 [Sanghuangporus sanghuang]
MIRPSHFVVGLILSLCASSTPVEDSYQAPFDASLPVAKNTSIRPLVLWHGLGDSYASPGMLEFAELIKGVHPGIFVHSIYLDKNLDADQRAGFFGNVNEQIDFVAEQLAGVQELKDGFDAIGFSQGGQFLRAYVERYNVPPVNNLLTFGSQHMGIADMPLCRPTDLLCNLARRAARAGVYSEYAQNNLIQAQYFRDPDRLPEYFASNKFLTSINNELPESVNETYTENLVTLSNLVLILFSEDRTVVPKESAWFGSYAPLQDDESTDLAKERSIIPMQLQPTYLADTFGLRTLDERGGVSFEVKKHHVTDLLLCVAFDFQPDTIFGLFLHHDALCVIAADARPRSLLVWISFENLAVLPLVLAIHHVCAVPVSAGNTSAAPPPVGGLTENPPAYVPLSDFDFQSLNLGLNQEYMELDLFNFALQRFSSHEFAAAGLGPNDEELIAFMASQEVGHATALTNILGEDRAAKPCNFSWPIKTVPEFIDLSQRITRIGESGVFGFLNKLNSRSSAQILTQSISTEASSLSQQLIFRQWEGLFPMPVWFETGITQSMQWTLMAPYFTSCPASNPEIKWNNYPALYITNSSSSSNNITSHQFSRPAIAPNVSSGLSSPGQTVHFSFEAPGKAIGPNSCFVTVTNTTGSPRFAAWISQLNVTYTELAEVRVGSGDGTGTASTIQPGGTVFQGKDDPIVNGTMFIVLTDSDPFVTPFNVSELDAHVVAGPAIYQSG